MAENDKPFACTSHGCGMRFTNEDHLTVHLKKHEMSLNLGQKGSVFVADQTPTPTRFIRNCEEVGLFQDLLKNPFEEQFRKAAEAAKAGGITIQELRDPLGEIMDDTLHTPHVFPTVDNDQATPPSLQSKVQQQDSSPAKSPELLPSSSPLVNSADDSGPAKQEASSDGLRAIKSSKSAAKTQTKQTGRAASVGQSMKLKPSILPTPPQTLEVAVATPPQSTENVQFLLKTADGQYLKLAGLPLVTTASAMPPASGDRVAAASTSPPVSGITSLARMRLKQVITGTSSANESSVLHLNTKQEQLPDKTRSRNQTVRKRQAAEDENSEKRMRFLERNRAAASRCREKRRKWINSLQERSVQLLKSNQTLQAEVSSLRKEVMHLKTMLLAHKDCPVTKAMQQGASQASGATNGLATAVGHEVVLASTGSRNTKCQVLTLPLNSHASRVASRKAGGASLLLVNSIRGATALVTPSASSHALNPPAGSSVSTLCVPKASALAHPEILEAHPRISPSPPTVTVSVPFASTGEMVGVVAPSSLLALPVGMGKPELSEVEMLKESDIFVGAETWIGGRSSQEEPMPIVLDDSE